MDNLSQPVPKHRRSFWRRLRKILKRDLTPKVFSPVMQPYERRRSSWRKVWKFLSRDVTPKILAAGEHPYERRRSSWRKVWKFLSQEVTPKFLAAGEAPAGRWHPFWRRFKRSNWGRRIKVAALAGALMFAVGAVYWLVFRFGDFQANRFGEQALLNLEFGNYRRASFLARRALQLDARGLKAARVMGRLCELAGSPVALAWYRQLARDAPSGENRLALARAALRFQEAPWTVASRMLVELEHAADLSAGQRGEYHSLAADLALLRKQPALAETHLREALRWDPKNELLGLRLAMVQLDSKEPAVVARAREALARLDSKPQLSVAASRALLAWSVMVKDTTQATSYALRLLTAPKLRLRDRFEALAVLKTSSPADFNSSLATLQREATNNSPMLGLVAQWMGTHGLGREAREWVRRLPPQSQSAPEVVYAIADGFAAEKDWDGFVSFLREQDWRERDYLRLAFLAKALRNRNDPGAATQWEKALALASRQAGGLASLYRTTVVWGWPAEGEQCLRAALEQSPAEKWPVRHLIAGYTKDGRTRELHGLFMTLAAQDRTDVIAKNNLALFSLLLRTNLPTAYRLAQEAHRSDPADAHYASTYAFSLWVAGKPSEALKVFAQLDPVTLQEPNIGAYYGILLAATGQAEKAKPYLANADRTRLLPEEIALLELAIPGR